jgi:hypothetical protein
MEKLLGRYLHCERCCIHLFFLDFRSSVRCHWFYVIPWSLVILKIGICIRVFWFSSLRIWLSVPFHVTVWLRWNDQFVFTKGTEKMEQRQMYFCVHSYFTLPLDFLYFITDFVAVSTNGWIKKLGHLGRVGLYIQAVSLGWKIDHGRTVRSLWRKNLIYVESEIQLITVPL